MSIRGHSLLPPLILLTMATVSMSSAAAIYVDCDNTSGQEDGTWEHPYRLISEGMDASVFGDTVAVLPGVYAEHFWVDMHDVMGMNYAAVIMKDGVVLLSTDGPDSTTIEGMGTQAAVYFDECGPLTALIGFTIETAGTGWGLRAGVLCYDGSPVIESNVMRGEMSGICGWMLGSPTITGNSLINSKIALGSGAGGAVIGNDIEGYISVSIGYPDSPPVRIESNTIHGGASRFSQGRETVGIRLVTSWGGSGEVTVLDNTIRDKDIGASLCCGQLRHNRFVDNTVNIEIRSFCSPWEDIQAEANWWGTTDPLEIDAKIIDCYDDPARESCVDFDPWCLDEACTQTAVGEFSWGAIKALYR